MKVLVVGLNPSVKHGESSTIRTLYGWFDQLNLDKVSFINLYDDYKINYKNTNLKYIQEISKKYNKILALGMAVSNSLLDMDVNHFRLPHPSGLNRQLNNKEFVQRELEECKYYLWGKS